MKMWIFFPLLVLLLHLMISTLEKRCIRIEHLAANHNMTNFHIRSLQLRCIGTVSEKHFSALCERFDTLIRRSAADRVVGVAKFPVRQLFDLFNNIRLSIIENMGRTKRTNILWKKMRWEKRLNLFFFFFFCINTSKFRSEQVAITVKPLIEASWTTRDPTLPEPPHTSKNSGWSKAFFDGGGRWKRLGW